METKGITSNVTTLTTSPSNSSFPQHSHSNSIVNSTSSILPGSTTDSVSTAQLVKKEEKEIPLSVKKKRKFDGYEEENTEEVFPFVTSKSLLLGQEPVYPDLYQQIFQFVSKCVTQSQFFTKDLSTSQLEIEAKLGRIVEKHSGERVSFPITCETILQSNQYRFESDMTLHQHAHYNQLLNSLVGPSKDIQYTHLYETDRLFPRTYHEKVRVTFNTQTNTIVPNGILIKSKLGSLDIHLPMASLDLRFSVNLETHVPFPKGIQVDAQERRKDRLSYSHEWLHVDLTQVKTFDRTTQRTTSVTHELEFELSNVHALLDLQQRSTDTPQMKQRLVYLIQNARRFADRALPTHKERRVR